MSARTLAAAAALAATWVAAAAQENGTTSAEAIEDTGTTCEDGLVIPMWLPQENLTAGDRFARGFVYFFAMVYLFIGVSIIADRFMASIEVITSKEKEITVKKANGETQIVVVRVWNETVANLTLMALGSSAPEILLSIIEIYAKNFTAGDLGPGTIVGSAAYNLFVIIALCIYVIPNGEVRKIKHLRVFFVTATWSVFAYVWLYLILEVISRGEVEVWEAFLTFLFFPATVLTAYIADRRLLIYKYLNKNYRMNKRGMIVETEGGGDLEMNNVDGMLKTFDEEENEEIREFEQNRREYITMLRELRKKHPNMDMEQIEAMAREEVFNKGPKSRAYYRIQATRKLVGGTNLVKKAQERDAHEREEVKEEILHFDEHKIRVYFDPGHYTVMENVGTFEVTVVREGGDPNAIVLVDYASEDGSANAGSDYMGVAGTLVFGPGEKEKKFSIEVLDDDVFEEDEHFYVRLTNLRFGSVDSWPGAQNGDANNSTVTATGKGTCTDELELAMPSLVTVMILDDDHGGIFSIAEKDTIELVESVGTYELRIVRWSGARGRVALPYTTEDGTAKEGKEYEKAEGEIIFENNESEKVIELHIMEEDSYEKDVLFYVQLGEPKMLGDLEAGRAAEAETKKPDELTEEDKMALLGRPKLGEITRAQIRIKESKEFKNTVDKLVQRANASIMVGTSSWKEQFVEAITVSGGDDDDGEEGAEREEKMPSCGDYVIHFLTLFWKLLFAFVPPTDRLGGWVCFFVSITWVGVLTAVIGDVASHFGCTLGIRDAVTAISIVALGTSIPDTFASKVAAIQDKYADASVGNVTGSNAVNVFLGIGIAWSIAAVHHALNGDTFKVDPGNLAFSVTIFCSEAALAIMILLLRRSKRVGGELGGPMPYKLLSSVCLFSLWLIYLLLSTLEAYDIIEGF
ncbi:sodium/calcium exchanger Calx isoform X3 [Cloeon dipterum]|uniref:sodium/calcium exchanger Calx isoform X3 n=1 Tax=Cloeon dipterum TaxID=197152 RepID=UPI00321FAF8A